MNLGFIHYSGRDSPSYILPRALNMCEDVKTWSFSFQSMMPALLKGEVPSFQACFPSNHDSVEKMCPWKMSLVLWIIPAKGDSIFNAHPKNNRRRCAYLGTHPKPKITLERWILFDTYPLVSSTHWKNWRSCCILITVKTHGSSCNYVLYIYLLRSSIYNNMPNLEMRWPSGVRSSCLFFGFGGSYCLEGYRHSETQRDPDGSVGGECDVMLELTQETWGLAPARPKTCSW